MSDPADPRPAAAAAADASVAPDSRRHAFPCRECGADTTWDPDADALRCDHCGTTHAVPRGEGAIAERSLTAAAAAAACGFGVERRVARCRECGAQVAFEDRATAETCVYCGSASVLDQEANRNAIRPESLVPLDVGRAAVEAAVAAWLKRLWFRPAALRKAWRGDAVGVYVPFWTFDCRAHSDWTADAGYYYWETETYWVTVNGRRETRTRQVRKVRWEPAWGARDDVYDEMLVSASGGLDERLLARVGSFDTGALVPYRPEYLAGWRAEEYRLDLAQAWGRAHERVEAEQLRRCAADVPGDTQRDLRVRNTVAEMRWKHILLPVWLLSYRYRGKTYTILVNGQSGRLAGEAPLSPWKILGLALLLLLLLAAVAAILELT